MGDSVEIPEDLYERIVQQVREICEAVAPPEEAPLLHEEQPSAEVHTRGENPVPDPAAPRRLAETGLNVHQLSDLILKHVYLQGSLTGFEIARQVRLPFSAVDEALEFLKEEHCLNVSSGNVVGRVSYRFVLTEGGRTRAREAFDECRYVGPAPVSLAAYVEQCQRQSLRHIRLNDAQLQEGFQHLVLDPILRKRLGPAISSGQAIFLHGGAGNGKTVIAKAIGQLINRFGGTIHVPYAISVDHQIVAVFDPSLHRPVERPADPSDLSDAIGSAMSDIDEPASDLRWQSVHRPVVITGGELSLEMLELRFHSGSGFYTAPLHVKANGGVFLLDDFGRQLVPPQQLLNRWILPLEERIDFLTLATGKKFSVPFEQLVIFSTNLTPAELDDPAFLRRIRHKIEVPPPTNEQFHAIFRRCCEQRNIHFDEWIVTRLLSHHYNPQIPPKSSDPRDLLDVLEAICRFRGEKPHLSEKLLTEAFEECLTS